MEISTNLICPLFSHICQPFSLSVISVIALLLTHFSFSHASPSSTMIYLTFSQVGSICSQASDMNFRKEKRVRWDVLLMEDTGTCQEPSCTALWHPLGLLFQLSSSKCLSFQGFSNLDMRKSHLGILLKWRVNFSRAEEEPTICIFNKLLGDTNADLHSKVLHHTLPKGRTNINKHSGYFRTIKRSLTRVLQEYHADDNRDS